MKKKAVNLLKTILLILLLCIPVLQFGNGVGVQAATKLATPKLVSAKAQGTSKIKVTWKKVSGATGYKIYRKEYWGTKWKAIKTVSKNTVTFTDTKINPGTYYSYTVRAVKNKTVLSGYNKKGVYAVTGLGYATNLKAHITEDNIIEISWKDIPLSSGYYIYRRTEGSSWKMIEKGCVDNYFEDSSSKGGIQYYYTVRPYVEYDKVYKGSYDKNGVKAPIISIKHDLQEYYEKLENYIQFYGYLNPANNRVISYQLKDMKDNKERCGIIYEHSNNVLKFFFQGDYAGCWEIMYVTLKLPEGEIYCDDLNCEVNYTYYVTGSGGEKFKTTAYFDGSNYVGLNTTFTIVENTTVFNKNFIQKHCNEILYKTLKSNETYILQENLELSLNKLGFNKI